jgi:hypothetical protein
MISSSDNPLAILVGRQLSAVVFVQDYVQFQFDGPVLTAITSPRVSLAGDEWSVRLAGYRDALCRLIGRKVQATSLAEGRELRIDLDDRGTLSVSLKPEDACGPESATFATSPEDLWVW